MKNLIVFILALGFCQHSFSLEKDNCFSAGIKAGLGAGFFELFPEYKEEGYEINNQGNFFGGVSFDYKILKNLYLGTEFLYTIRGGGFREVNDTVMVIHPNGGNGDENEYFRHNFNIKSFDVPIYLKGGINNRKELYFLSLGLAPSLLLKSIHKYNTWTYSWTFADEDWHEEEYDDLDMSFSMSYLIGFGIRINLKRVVLIPELRYTRYLRNEIVLNNEVKDSKNYTFNVAFSVLFH